MYPQMIHYIRINSDNLNPHLHWPYLICQEWFILHLWPEPIQQRHCICVKINDKGHTCCTIRWVAVSGDWDSLRSWIIWRRPSSCGCHAMLLVIFFQYRWLVNNKENKIALLLSLSQIIMWITQRVLSLFLLSSTQTTTTTTAENRERIKLTDWLAEFEKNRLVPKKPHKIHI